MLSEQQVSSGLGFPCFHNFHQALDAGVVLGFGEVSGIRLVSVKAGDRDAAGLTDLAAHLGHEAGPQLAGTGRVHQQAFHGVCLAQQYIAEGGIGYAKELLEQALGAEKATDVISRLTASLQVKPFEFVR